MKIKKWSDLLSTPLGVVAVLSALIATIELLIMLVVEDALVPAVFSAATWNYVDASLLTLILAPALYFLVFQKMQKDIIMRKQAEAELIAAKQVAERANRVKSQFISRMSHELRTPLNAIIGFSQLIEIDALAEGEDTTLENIHYVLQASGSLLLLINEVLDFARLETGKLLIEPLQTNLLMVAIDSIGAVRQVAEARTIEMRLLNQLLENHGEIWADPLRTMQAVLNLLSNAIKFNKEGGNIDVALETLNSEFVRLSVKDTGIGIPEEDVGEVFLPFSRLHANNAFIEGAGLGLSITKDLVEKMGGRIGVKSIKGEGSTFWIDMPTYTGQAHT